MEKTAGQAALGEKTAGSGASPVRHDASAVPQGASSVRSGASAARIAVLESAWNERGRGSWDGLASLGELAGIYTHCTRDQVLERVREPEIFVTGSIRWDEELFCAAVNCRMLAVNGTGVDLIDLGAATRHGVVVANVPDYACNAVAQTAIALVLELANRTGSFDAAIHAGRWDKSRALCGALPILELAGKTFGVVGMGGIGQAAARMAQGLGMDVVFWNRSARPALERTGVRQVAFDELLATSDVVSLHCAATPQTRHLFDVAAFAQMKSGAFLVNTARGALVDEAALVDALRGGRLGGAGLDVLEHEPIAPDNPLLGLPNVVLTPHVGWMAREALVRLLDAIEDNIAAFLAGRPTNVVNPAVLEKLGLPLGPPR